jgi:peptidoglycan-N-acetylglucosamine deacetylase
VTFHFRNFALWLAMSGFIFSAIQQAFPCPPEALGTSRILPLGTGKGLNIGLRTYPQTLALADHEVVLTFDDGPHPATTARILEALKAECVQATFFLIGRNALAYPALVVREKAEGHTIGTHSMTHPAQTLRNMSFDAAKADIQKGMEAVSHIAFGKNQDIVSVPFFRFPGFGDSEALNMWLAERGIVNFGTDLWASDWQAMTPQTELNLVLRRLETTQRGIILFHDTKMQTAAMLPDFLKTLKKYGYRIVHLVPGSEQPELAPAPEGWTSQTEATLHRLFKH